MQPCNRIYYSTVHWRLNMFRAAYRSSSGALTVFATSGLHTLVVTGRSQVWVGHRSPYAYVNQRLQLQLELLMMSGMQLETCEPSMNGGIINSVTRLRLVGYFYWIIQNFINTNRVERLMALLIKACKFIESNCFEVYIKIPTSNHKCHTDKIINYFINVCMWVFVSVLPVSL
jgi:hypothetical protein